MESTANMGRGFPDIIVGLHDAYDIPVNLLVEIKDGDKPPSGRRLTDDEIEFHTDWKGQVCVIETEQQAVDTVNDIVSNGYEQWVRRTSNV